MTNTAWEAFKKTGDIKLYLAFKKMENLEGSSNEANQIKWNHFSGK